MFVRSGTKKISFSQDTKGTDSSITEDTSPIVIPQLQQQYYPLYAIDKIKPVKILRDIQLSDIYKKLKKPQKKLETSENDREKEKTEIHIDGEHTIRKFWETVKNNQNIQDEESLFSAGSGRRTEVSGKLLRSSTIVDNTVVANLFKQRLLESLTSSQKMYESQKTLTFSANPSESPSSSSSDSSNEEDEENVKPRFKRRSSTVMPILSRLCSAALPKKDINPEITIIEEVRDEPTPTKKNKSNFMGSAKKYLPVSSARREANKDEYNDAPRRRSMMVSSGNLLQIPVSPISPSSPPIHLNPADISRRSSFTNNLNPADISRRSSFTNNLNPADISRRSSYTGINFINSPEVSSRGSFLNTTEPRTPTVFLKSPKMAGWETLDSEKNQKIPKIKEITRIESVKYETDQENQSEDSSHSNENENTLKKKPAARYFKQKIISNKDNGNPRKVILSKQFNVSFDSNPIFSQIYFNTQDSPLSRQGSRKFSFTHANSNFSRCFSNKSIHFDCPKNLKIFGIRSKLYERAFTRSSNPSKINHSFSETMITQKKIEKKAWVPIYPSMLETSSIMKVRKLEPHRINVEGNLYTRLRSTQLKKPILKSLLIC
ncbi:unnamed protein product [Blepharisma stoltei]|uniref:Uncharacterized protein n=1 Tax=Blepharisma stoltei TaxID=1481888 RepID=A0AAU9KBA9_9CILI|nr:unnamed protein product [Blepharisma stoltei]